LNETVEGLVANKGADETVQVWVPGCATGHEAYTIAILLRDVGNQRPKIRYLVPTLMILLIAAARLRHYQLPITWLSPERLERWFKLHGNEAVIVPEIHEMCVFSLTAS
jgi:two-component system CheB/CheR fusion protein